MFIAPEQRPAGDDLGRENLPTLDEAAKLLLKAAAVIEERGWCQGQAQIGESVCIVGSLHIADIGRIPDYLEGAWPKVRNEALNRLQKSFGGRFKYAADWNDAPGRIKAEVVAKLRAVALGG